LQYGVVFNDGRCGEVCQAEMWPKAELSGVRGRDWLPSEALSDVTSLAMFLHTLHVCPQHADQHAHPLQSSRNHALATLRSHCGRASVSSGSHGREPLSVSSFYLSLVYDRWHRTLYHETDTCFMDGTMCGMMSTTQVFNSKKSFQC
jgi:hypothetical protein